MGTQFRSASGKTLSNRHINGRLAEATIGGGGSTGNCCDDVLMFLYAGGFVNISVQLSLRGSLLTRGGGAVNADDEAGAEAAATSDGGISG